MSGNYKKEDLRVKKTFMFINNAMTTLLKRRDFKQLTINDLCEEALISRATFYAHFKDKYDLLEFWFKNLIKSQNETDRFSNIIDTLIYGDSKIIQHIISGADSETIEILNRVIASSIAKSLENEVDADKAKDLVFSNFCAGGLVHMFFWQAGNSFSPEILKTREYFHELMQGVINWHNKKGSDEKEDE